MSQSNWTHGTAAQTAVLLVNLGTPDAPTARALRPYLKEFLSDRRVIEIWRPLWWLILNGIILNVRPKKSAEKYAQIWMAEGSPLRVHTERQVTLLRGYLGERLKSSNARSSSAQPPGVPPLVVDHAMRYGNPSLPSVLARLREQNCERILLLPAYPQYAASTVGTVFDVAFRALTGLRNPPELRCVKHYHDDPRYIAALAQSVRDHWMKHGRPDKLLMSFHGVPKATLDAGDPYHCECQKTGRLLAEALGLDSGRYQVCFQSRFGRAEWLQPYTAVVLAELGRQKVGRVDVVCPGFVADCLETLEEIAMEGKTTFLQAGGGEFHAIPCLNERDDWMQALTEIALDNLSGWIKPGFDAAAASRSEAQSRDAALKMGAVQ